MIVLYGVLTGIAQVRRGVLLEEALLDVSASAEQTVYSGEAYGDPVTATVTPGSGSAATAASVMRFAQGPEPPDFYLAAVKTGWVLYPLLLAGCSWALRRLP